VCVNFFFFSSRRRHTRFSRDWSSDVCSSDLAVEHGALAGVGVAGKRNQIIPVPLFDAKLHELSVRAGGAAGMWWRLYGEFTHRRSEERRVGKECRSRGARAHREAEADLRVLW